MSGNHYIFFNCLADTAVFIDERPIFDAVGDSADMMAMLPSTAPEERKQFTFQAGQSYKIRIISKAKKAEAGSSLLLFPMVMFRFGFLQEAKFNANLLTHATETARSSDVAIVFVGHSTVWETEGCDRDSMDLPVNSSQDRLIEAVAKANKKTIVVNSTGSPVTMPWVSSVPAIVQTWFPGQEAGLAIADVLLGKTNPSSKPPVTFPKHYKDTPAYGKFPNTGRLEDLHIDYVEDIFMGYRHCDRVPETVLFLFGRGLSYTRFELTNIKASQSTLNATLIFDVTLNMRYG